MGPLVTREHRDKVASYLGIGEAAGATVAIDGREHDIAGDPNGFWLGPCLIDNVTEDMQVYTDEIFGPVLSMVRVDTVDDAIGADRTQRVRQRRGDLYRATAAPRNASRPKWKRAWSASTSPFRCPSRTTPLGDGTTRSSVTFTSTVPMASSSTRGARP